MLKHMIDDTDRALLNLLQDDAQLSIAQLAERTHLSPSSCWRRVRSLQDSGAIDAYTVRIDPERVGLTFEAIVHLQLDRHDSEGVNRLSDLLETRPEVIDCYATTGAADYHMRILCADIDAYNRFLEDVLFKNSSVRSAQTNVVLKRVKAGNRIRL